MRQLHFRFSRLVDPEPSIATTNFFRESFTLITCSPVRWLSSIPKRIYQIEVTIVMFSMAFGVLECIGLGDFLEIRDGLEPKKENLTFSTQWDCLAAICQWDLSFFLNAKIASRTLVANGNRHECYGCWQSSKRCLWPASPDPHTSKYGFDLRKEQE